MLLFSLADFRTPDHEMHQLLNSYVVGMGELVLQPYLARMCSARVS
ncbi:MAG: hypothetical protein GW911_31260 [Armatimonadetes bacterium]|nr:hypothetical protein [Armatimonadota bacterium]NCO92877.1 hypothetical protein [Armatimonadota bacterium]NCP34700.1 hypothetical protein [Armatimonadota bacterium]NCQ30749.1 hypothetical protein [Armatimonadota bacterium]NDK16531.1 hypothetical protein [Armatimonadota bacterium]